ncbi:GAF domain-containing protein [Nocardia sp. NPDC052566]|uniref:GAF domain-containing protein n=1 Tax=Nocardia sp. NPDC052566 TaxID=3364330 RepID=UPI0037C94421
MAESDWLLIETLTATAEPTVVADGARIKDWAAQLRVRKEFGATVPLRIVEVVRRARETGCAETRAEGGITVTAVPVRCAFDEVHGVQVWVGPEGDVPPPRPRVAAWDWDADSELAHHGPGLEELVFARAPEDVRVIRTPPEAFGRMVRFDGRIEYFAMVATLDGRYQGDVDMIGDDDRVRTFQMVTRGDPLDRRVRALMHLLADDPLIAPGMDMQMMRAVSRRSTRLEHADDGVGFVWLASGLIYEWTRTPSPPLDRWATELPKLHPDDAPAYLAVCDELSGGAGQGRQVSLRVRFDDTEWIAVSAELRPVLPLRSGHALLRIRREEPN